MRFSCAVYRGRVELIYSLTVELAWSVSGVHIKISEVLVIAHVN